MLEVVDIVVSVALAITHPGVDALENDRLELGPTDVVKKRLPIVVSVINHGWWRDFLVRKHFGVWAPRVSVTSYQG